jgi:hypothetical protein
VKEIRVETRTTILKRKERDKKERIKNGITSYGEKRRKQESRAFGNETEKGNAEKYE